MPGAELGDACQAAAERRADRAESTLEEERAWATKVQRAGLTEGMSYERGPSGVSCPRQGEWAQESPLHCRWVLSRRH